jgi:hypothetical protein
MGRIPKGRLSRSSARKFIEKQKSRGAENLMNEDQGTSSNMLLDQEPSVVVNGMN